MKFRFLYNPEVYDDLLKAIEWYDDKQSGLGDKFLIIARNQFKALQTSALQYAVRYDDIRCSPLKKFSYMIHYRVDLENKTVN